MLVYTLDPLTLEKTDVIEDYQSCIWTERFIEPGDVRIVMGATHDNAVKLRPGAMLLHEESNEPMLIDSRDIKGNQITATGKTIEAFFNERTVGPLGRAGLAANIIRYVVYNMQNRQAGRYAIPNLRPQDFEADADAMGYKEHILAFEGGHDAVLRLAKQYSKGIAVIRQPNPDTGALELVFVVRDVNDRTQPGDYVRFSPQDETFVNVDELYSLQDWVDVILVHAPKSFVENKDGSAGIAWGWAPMSYPEWTSHGGPYNFNLTPSDNPFDWRIKEIATDDITLDTVKTRLEDVYGPELGYSTTWSDLTDIEQGYIIREEMKAKAKAEWHSRQASQKVVFDGEVPGEILKYGRDYRLGDLVVVEGNFTGGKQPKMVSEYIRSADASGKRSYPTLAAPLDPFPPDTFLGP